MALRPVSASVVLGYLVGSVFAVPATRSILAVLLLGVSAAGGVSQAQSEGNPNERALADTETDRNDRSHMVDSLMAPWSRGDSPGAAVMVIQDGRPLHAKGYGLANVPAMRPIDAGTVFDLASLSKQFTAMAAMILFEDGKLSYDDEIGKYLPGFPADARRITIRQLLNHTSGMPDYTLSWGESAKLKGGEQRTVDRAVQFLASQRRLRFVPGERWEYSNSNYVLMAQIVSVVSGKPFPEFVRSRIFLPLGMSESFVYDRGHPPNGALAVGYVRQGSAFRPAKRNLENYVFGDGQVYSSLNDMVQWDKALLAGTLVKASTLQEAFAPGRLNDGTPLTYGFGWGLGSYQGVAFVGHGGETDGYAAQITRFLEPHLTVIILSNVEGLATPYALANKIAAIYLPKSAQQSATRTAPAQSADVAGKYSLYDSVLNIAATEGHLWLTPSGQKRVALVPAGRDEFFIEGGGGSSRIRFIRNADGRVRCLSLLDQNGVMFFR